MESSITINVKNLHLNAPPVKTVSGFKLFSLEDIICPAAKKPRETRYLGNGEPLNADELEKELAALEPGWAFEESHELYGEVCYDYKNKNGAYSRDETIKSGWHWTKTKHPEGGRVVVGFGGGNVNLNLVNFRAFARVVRVASQ